ncbi:DUF2971 domain-containing protein [Enterobacter bugandensis]|uniref:DUF2971 domain-containing protein n=1 Tax=Enterobacter bugandensis TaxID=881260 RepID=UPI002FD3544E
MIDVKDTLFPPKGECSKFYKYVKFEDCIKVLEEGTLWYSKPVNFNDPFDCYPYFPEKGREKVFKRLNKQFLLEQKAPRKRLRSNFSLMSQTGTDGLMHRIVSENLTVTCFSTDHLSAPMWAHYANEHQGCVIEFQFNSNIVKAVLNSGRNDPLIVPFRVRYSDHRPPLFDKNGDLLGLEIALSKSTQWSYEQEVRALSNREGIHHFSRLQISKVYTGVRISDANKNALKRTIANMNQELNMRCKLVELGMSFRNYQFVELD